MDNSPEFLNALHYAATRAAKTGGGVEVLAIITPQDQTHWLGVAEKMREEARETIEESFQIYSNWMKDELKLEAELVIREGEKATEVLNQISEDKEVGVLVLGANNSSEGSWAISKPISVTRWWQLAYTCYYRARFNDKGKN